MNTHALTLAGRPLALLPSGALWDRALGLLCVSDLHLGKSDRIARRLGLMLPPYEAAETLDRLAADLEATGARRVICLGDSFDDPAAAAALDPAARARLLALMAGRDWTWIEGNHDPGPLDLGGSHRAELTLGGLTYRHIARPGATAEVSGHYHPKYAVPGGGGARPACLHDGSRAILPAYGTYTGGLSALDPALRPLLGATAFAVLLGPRPVAVPLPSAADSSARKPRASRLFR